MRSHFRKAVEGNAQYVEVLFNHANRSRLILSVSMVPMIVDESIVGVYLLAKDISSQRKIEEINYHLSYHDPLTKLPNRRFFKMRMETELEKAKKSNSQVAIMFLDLDRFKTVNDTLGHTVGDELLTEVAARFLKCIPFSDCLFRFGGDEFTVILPNFGREEAANVANAMIQSLQKPFSLGGQEFLMGVSIDHY